MDMKDRFFDSVVRTVIQIQTEAEALRSLLIAKGLISASEWENALRVVEKEREDLFRRAASPSDALEDMLRKFEGPKN